MAKAAMTTARCYPVRRFLSTDVVQKGETVAAAATSSVVQNSTPESVLKKQPPRQRRKNNKKKEKASSNPPGEQKQDMAAAVVASEEKREEAAPKKGGKKEAKGSKEALELKGKKKQKTLTRLVDNHPLTEDDLEPRKFLLHLTQDKLDAYPPTPVFSESVENKLPTVHRVIGKDANGNEVTVEEHLPPKDEQEMNKDGFFFTNDRMYGYTNHTPLFFHTDVTPRELEDAEFNDSLALKSGLEPNGMDDPYYYEEGEEGEGEGEGEMEEIHEDEMELDPKAVGNLSDDPNQGDESADVDGLIVMKQIGDWIEGSALHAGSDIQLDLELEMLARSVEDRRVRRQYLQLERGYDNREFDNAAPWVDTHRIEAIDSRLRELHRMRDAGELEYPIEKDAAEEARRIKKEHQLVLRSLNRALNSSKNSKGSELASDEYLYSSSSSSKQKKHRREVIPKAAKQVDSSLDSMDVYSIPLEKLYQARRQELDKLRETAYEDFDLDYLLSKSGKPFPSRGNAASLYEYRHGHTESTRLPSAQEQAEQIAHFDHVPSSLNPAARASLGRDVLLFDRLRRLSSKEAAGLYSGKVRMITPEMEEAEEKEKEERAMREKMENGEEEDAALSSALFEQGEPKESEESFDRTVDSLTKEERVDAVDAKYTVDSEMDTLLRDPKKPLEDYEMALTKDGDVKFAWRTNRQEVADFARDKKRFMSQFEHLVNHSEVKPGEEAMLKNTVITSEDMAAARRAVGQPSDVSDEVFAKRYLAGWKAKAGDAELVSNLLGGYSMEHPEKMLKDLGLDSEDGIERYLMGTFEAHEAPEDQLLPEELLQARGARERAEKVIEQLQKRAEEAEKAKQSQAEKRGGEGEGEAAKSEGETAKSEEETVKAEGETAKSEGETAKAEGESVESESSPFKTTFTTMDETPISSNPTNLSDAFTRLMERFDQDGEEAVSILPDEETEVIGEGHIVDALEYSDQVYVHEKDRQMMYAMYQRGVSPREISQSFGFDERRVYAILRLMQDRPRHQKEGTFAAEGVDAMEEKESPWNYDYRDFPPQSYRYDDHRKAGKVPTHLPKFVFLKEGEEERKVMKEVEAIVNRQKREKEVRIERKGIPLGESMIENRKG